MSANWQIRIFYRLESFSLSFKSLKKKIFRFDYSKLSLQFNAFLRFKKLSFTTLFRTTILYTLKNSHDGQLAPEAEKWLSRLSLEPIYYIVLKILEMFR